MATCQLCGHDMLEAEACIERLLVFDDPTDGEIERVGDEDDVYKPIPYGDESTAMTYEEVLETYEAEIEAGGRGKLSIEKTRHMRDAFTDAHPDAESYQNRTCHDCGVRVGDLHHPGCDREECPNPECDEHQLFICGCQPHVLTKGDV